MQEICHTQSTGLNTPEQKAGLIQTVKILNAFWEARRMIIYQGTRVEGLRLAF